MDNVNEALLNRPKLDGTPEEEEAAAKGLRNETVKARTGNVDIQKDISGTPNQILSSARKMADPMAGMSEAAVGDSASSSASKGTSKLLQQSWVNVPDSFGLSLIYTNIHVFLNKVLGKKFFCDLGEEWLSPEAQATPAGQAFARKAGLLEKIILIFVDLVIFCVVIGVLMMLVTIISFMTDNFFEKTVKIFQAITTLGWSGVMAMINLFNP